MARDSLKESLKLTKNNKVAKNVILFIGDGLGLSTVAASRIYKGQKMGHTGEETVLEFEKFPHVALSKVSMSYTALFVSNTYKLHIVT